MKLSCKELKIISMVLASFGVIMIGNGIKMNKKLKPVTKVEYTLKVSNQRISKQLAKKTELKLKDITVEENNPISLKVEDYLEEPESIGVHTMKNLKLDTSLVNLSQPGTYQYTITNGKKKYLGKVIVKEKELPDIEIKTKTINLNIGDALPATIDEYIENVLVDEIKNKIDIDILDVSTKVAGDYPFYIIYKNTRYEGVIKVREKGPNFISKITPKKITISVGDKLSNEAKDYIEETLDEARYKNIKLDLSNVRTDVVNPDGYTYKITYNNVEYEGKIIVLEKSNP